MHKSILSSWWWLVAAHVAVIEILFLGEEHATAFASAGSAVFNCPTIPSSDVIFSTKDNVNIAYVRRVNTTNTTVPNTQSSYMYLLDSRCTFANLRIELVMQDLYREHIAAATAASTTTTTTAGITSSSPPLSLRLERARFQNSLFSLNAADFPIPSDSSQRGKVPPLFFEASHNHFNSSLSASASLGEVMMMYPVELMGIRIQGRFPPQSRFIITGNHFYDRIDMGRSATTASVDGIFCFVGLFNFSSLDAVTVMVVDNAAHSTVTNTSSAFGSQHAFFRLEGGVVSNHSNVTVRDNAITAAIGSGNTTTSSTDSFTTTLIQLSNVHVENASHVVIESNRVSMSVAQAGMTGGGGAIGLAECVVDAATNASVRITNNTISIAVSSVHSGGALYLSNVAAIYIQDTNITTPATLTHYPASTTDGNAADGASIRGVATTMMEESVETVRFRGIHIDHNQIQVEASNVSALDSICGIRLQSVYPVIVSKTPVTPTVQTAWTAAQAILQWKHQKSKDTNNSTMGMAGAIVNALVDSAGTTTTDPQSPSPFSLLATVLLGGEEAPAGPSWSPSSVERLRRAGVFASMTLLVDGNVIDVVASNLRAVRAVAGLLIADACTVPVGILENQVTIAARGLAYPSRITISSVELAILPIMLRMSAMVGAAAATATASSSFVATATAQQQQQQQQHSNNIGFLLVASNNCTVTSWNQAWGFVGAFGGALITATGPASGVLLIHNHFNISVIDGIGTSAFACALTSASFAAGSPLLLAGNAIQLFATNVTGATYLVSVFVARVSVIPSSLLNNNYNFSNAASSDPDAGATNTILAIVDNTFNVSFGKISATATMGAVFLYNMTCEGGEIALYQNQIALNLSFINDDSKGAASSAAASGSVVGIGVGLGKFSGNASFYICADNTISFFAMRVSLLALALVNIEAAATNNAAVIAPVGASEAFFSQGAQAVLENNTAIVTFSDVALKLFGAVGISGVDFSSAAMAAIHNNNVVMLDINRLRCPLAALIACGTAVFSNETVLAMVGNRITTASSGPAGGIDSQQSSFAAGSATSSAGGIVLADLTVSSSPGEVLGGVVLHNLLIPPEVRSVRIVIRYNHVALRIRNTNLGTFSIVGLGMVACHWSLTDQVTTASSVSTTSINPSFLFLAELNTVELDSIDCLRGIFSAVALSQTSLVGSAATVLFARNRLALSQSNANPSSTSMASFTGVGFMDTNVSRGAQLILRDTELTFRLISCLGCFLFGIATQNSMNVNGSGSQFLILSTKLSIAPLESSSSGGTVGGALSVNLVALHKVSVASAAAIGVVNLTLASFEARNTPFASAFRGLWLQDVDLRNTSLFFIAGWSVAASLSYSAVASETIGTHVYAIALDGVTTIRASSLLVVGCAPETGPLDPRITRVYDILHSLQFSRTGTVMNETSTISMTSNDTAHASAHQCPNTFRLAAAGTGVLAAFAATTDAKAATTVLRISEGGTVSISCNTFAGSASGLRSVLLVWNISTSVLLQSTPAAMEIASSQFALSHNDVILAVTDVGSSPDPSAPAPLSLWSAASLAAGPGTKIDISHNHVRIAYPTTAEDGSSTPSTVALFTTGVATGSSDGATPAQLVLSGNKVAVVGAGGSRPVTAFAWTASAAPVGHWAVRASPLTVNGRVYCVAPLGTVVAAAPGVVISGGSCSTTRTPTATAPTPTHSRSPPATRTQAAVRTKTQLRTNTHLLTPSDAPLKSNTSAHAKTATISLVIIEPQPPAWREERQRAETASVAVLVGGGFSLGAAAAGQLGVGMGLLRMASCLDASDDDNDGGDDDGAAEPLPLVVHPLQFGLGGGERRFVRAALLGNAVLLPAAAGVLARTVGALLVRRVFLPGATDAEARDLMGWPSVLAMPLVAFAEPTGMAAAALLGSGDALDAALGAVGAAVVAAAFAAWAVAIRRRLVGRVALHRRTEPVSRALWLLTPLYEWAPAAGADEAQATEASVALERLAHVVGDKLHLYAELAATACAVCVGVLEGMPLATEGGCRARVVTALVLAIVQGGLDLLVSVPAEAAVFLALGTTVVALGGLVVHTVFANHGAAGSDTLELVGFIANCIAVGAVALTILIAIVRLVLLRRRLLDARANGLHGSVKSLLHRQLYRCGLSYQFEACRGEPFDLEKFLLDLRQDVQEQQRQRRLYYEMSLERNAGKMEEARLSLSFSLLELELSTVESSSDDADRTFGYRSLNELVVLV